jgi:hypothetical protein
MDVRTAISHCQTCAYSVTCLTDSPGTLICFIGVIRHYHLAPEKLQPGWFTELLLSLGSLSGKVAASSPRIVGSKRLSKVEQQTGIALAGRLGLKPNPHELRVGRYGHARLDHGWSGIHRIPFS